MMKRTESKRLNWLLTLALVLVLAAGIFSLPTWVRAEEGVEPSHAVVFSYGTKEYTLTVGSEVRLEDVLTSLGLNGEVTAAQVSNAALFTVKKDADDQWNVKALRKFSTPEWMKLTIGGREYTISAVGNQVISLKVMVYDMDSNQEYNYDFPNLSTELTVKDFKLLVAEKSGINWEKLFIGNVDGPGNAIDSTPLYQCGFLPANDDTGAPIPGWGSVLIFIAKATVIDGSGQYYPQTELSYVSKWEPGTTLKLLADVNLGYSGLEIKEGTADNPMILDLNGFELSYGSEDKNIKIEGGALKLIDSSKAGTGKIVGREGANFAGITVSNASNSYFEMAGGTIEGFGNGVELLADDLGDEWFDAFKMTGGTIQKNSTGVKGVRTRRFFMEDGKITGNYGHGVELNSGAIILSGGEITNTTGEYSGGYGIKGNGTIAVSGNPAVTGNKNGNVYLDKGSNQKILIQGALTDGAQIGVTLAEYDSHSGEFVPTTGVFTSTSEYLVRSENYTLEEPWKYFTSDLAEYSVGKETTLIEQFYREIPEGLLTTAHVHDGDTFNPWTETTSLPSGGRYYLTAPVTVSDTTTITGTLHLCLNGRPSPTSAQPAACLRYKEMITVGVTNLP